MQKPFLLILALAFVLPILSCMANPVSENNSALPWSDESKCSKQDAIASSHALDNLKTWDSIYSWFNTFKHCDYHSGEVAEGLADIITRLLADDWSHFSQFERLAKQDTTFRAFALRSEEHTSELQSLRAVANNAQRSAESREGK